MDKIGEAAIVTIPLHVIKQMKPETFDSGVCEINAHPEVKPQIT